MIKVPEWKLPSYLEEEEEDDDKNLPPVTHQQSLWLQEQMAKHYQLLIQQASLALWAEHVQKDSSNFLTGGGLIAWQKSWMGL